MKMVFTKWTVFCWLESMKEKIFGFSRTKFIFASPWLLAAAAGLLVLIIVTFAFHNLGLEKRLMTTALVQKAATLMRVIHSGARASFVADIRKSYWDSEPWQHHAQQVIDHLAEDPELRFLSIVDSQGQVIAHSNHDIVGSYLDFVVPAVNLGRSDKKVKLHFSVVSTGKDGRVFKAVRAFAPYFPVLPKFFNRSADSLRRNFLKHGRIQGKRYGMPFPSINNTTDEKYFVIAGLDMSEYDRTLGRIRLQLIILSVAMLLVGIGGWFSLSAVQGYRISQKTLDDFQAFTSLLIAGLPIGLIATDRSGRIATWNQRVVELTGITKPDANDRRPSDILPPRLANYFLDQKNTSHSQDTGCPDREILITLNERELNLLCQLITIQDREQHFMGKVLLLSDISELKLLELKMRENERLAAIGRMAGGVAHEIRNPLSSVKGLALLLRNKFTDDSKEQNTADLLIQETERINRTISEMLSFTSHAPLNLEPVDVAELLHRALRIVENEVTDGNIMTRLSIDPDLPPVAADLDRLNQVIMNILFNAIQAMDGGGMLSIKAKKQAGAKKIELSISDTGCGMDETTLSQVFYPYFTTKKGGTGIGMALSQKIVTDHNGSIYIESKPGQGATVFVILPLSTLL